MTEEEVGRICLMMGGGRYQAPDPLDHSKRHVFRRKGLTLVVIEVGRGSVLVGDWKGEVEVEVSVTEDLLTAVRQAFVLYREALGVEIKRTRERLLKLETDLKRTSGLCVG